MNRLFAALALALLPLVGVAAPAIAGGDTTCLSPRGDGSVKSKPAVYRKADTWLYGDSITHQSWRGLHPKGGVAVDAIYGRNTRNALAALRADLRRYPDPKVIVMALGTNDYRDVANFRTQVRKVTKVVPKRVRLVWVNTWSSTRPNTPKLNAVIDAAPRTTVVRWARAARAAKLTFDGTHVNERGCRVRNQLIREALAK